ncbi:MAG: HEAT repeat domain-containing protein [Planctomycetota bacterium]
MSQPATIARPCRTRAIIAIGVLGLLPASGCETLSQDLNEFAQSFSPKSPLEAAAMASDLNDPDRRREGIVLLSNAPFGGEEAYVKLYREYATVDPDPLARAAAIRALARHGRPSDAIVVVANLANENHAVRWAAAKGMQRLHEPRAIPEILKVLRDRGQDGDVRAALANALGQYPENAVFDGLLGALDARQLSINIAAERSLITLTGQDLGADASVWLHWHRGMIADGKDPFAGRSDYRYPTYQRDETFFEKLTFWTSEPRELPGPPVGSESIGTRETYGGSPPAESKDAGPRSTYHEPPAEAAASNDSQSSSGASNGSTQSGEGG